MPVNITDSDAFTDPLQMPLDDEVADASDFLSTTIQGLANRTFYGKSRIDEILTLLKQHARIELSGSGVASGSKFQMTNLDQVSGAGFTMDGTADTFTVPESGIYIVSLFGYLTGASTDNPLELGIQLHNGLSVAKGTRFSATNTHKVGVAATKRVGLSSASNYEVRAYSSDGTVAFSDNGFITIQRVLD